jgi:uncharacterized protein YabE (DUF348 family)
VTLSVDGATTKVSTFSGTVGEVLEDRGVRVSSRDVVAPAPGTKITDGTRIAVQYGRQVKLKVDGEDKTFWTTATTVGDALEVAGIDSAGAALSTSRSSTIGRQGVDLKVATEKAVVINAAGRKRVVQTTAQTVGGALAAAKITVDGNDLLSAKKTAKLTDGTRVTYTKVDVRTVTKKRAVDFPTVRKNTSSLTKGLSRVDTTGKDGVRTTTYRQTLHNGTVKVTERTTSVITTKPRARVILVGTKELSPPAPRKSSSPANKSSSASNSSSASRSSSSSSRSSSSSSRSSGSSPSRSTSSPSVASGSVWDRLAQCEAGGNWSINTGNGFYGGLQFTLSTWRGHGGSGMPHHASREAQIAVAKRVQANQGWGAWPACTSKLGIR